MYDVVSPNVLFGTFRYLLPFEYFSVVLPYFVRREPFVFPRMPFASMFRGAYPNG